MGTPDGEFVEEDSVTTRSRSRIPPMTVWSNIQRSVRATK
jgi:hypothetical protein